MRILLDENVPSRLKEDLKGYEVFTIRDKSWQSKKNGELIKLMVENNIENLITFDKNLQHQQNIKKYPIKVITLIAVNNTYETLKRFIDPIKRELEKDFNSGFVNIQL